MYNYKKNTRPTSLAVRKVTEGETLETKIERIVTNKEPIKDGAPLIYQDKAEGVNLANNIRTDRFEVAVETMDKVNRSNQAKRQANLNIVKTDENIDVDKNDGGVEDTGN